MLARPGRFALGCLAAGVSCLLLLRSAKSETATVYVGTYADGASRGIYRFTFDLATGAAGVPALAVETQNPAFLGLHPSRRFLYAVGESDGFGGRPTGALAAFAIAADGRLTLLNQQASEGPGPCHLAVDRAGRHLLVANYRGGTVAVLPIAADGRLQPAVSVRAHQGSGPDPRRQAGPHAHGVYLDASESFLLAPDLGADRVFRYRFDAKRGQLEPAGGLVLASGAGPRHLAFDPSGKRLYVINELSSTVSAFRYGLKQAEPTPFQTLSTLPAGTVGTNTAAEIALSADGRFLYASNRGHDSIAVFDVAADGRLSLRGHAPAGGQTPRHFSLDPSGRWLLVAHQGSDSVAVFRLDDATGLPGPPLASLSLPKPSCLLFAGAGRSGR